ncbi:Sulfate permease 2 [Alternaria arborescens]|uniref:Sulfate permease 2 n=1 Tax=Alternaria arborescens TaxID=156630 RepID=UPI001074A42F|nr:Sulfate permease 2 [Alternaria arborescens]RYO11816.1 Sulfate permease 2 [Alternaria arborescens]
MDKDTYITRLRSKILQTTTPKQSQSRFAVPESLPSGVVPYLEEEPTVKEWLCSFRLTRQSIINFLCSLFPCTSWLRRYNVHWLLGDAIAGLTVGFVVIPQAMAYALLAGLSPEYGLYTSFMGAALYWIFGTSKDVVIGTTAVGSLLVGEVITTIQTERPGEYTAEDIAKALSLLSGFVLIFLGLCRLGWLIELIPYIPVSAFVTSASFTIIGTQLPVALGITGIKTREAPYKVYIGILKGLGRTQLDASIGLTSIVLLYVLKNLFTHLETRQPKRKRLWATLSSLRMTFTILLFTLVSWLVHRKRPRDDHAFRIVGHIDSGFTHAGVPKVSSELFGLVAPSLPSIIIILIVEHVAIAKAFSRQFGYEVNPSQEILAQGSSNALGTFVGGYACTGSFGASAVLAKSGVKTPLATFFSAVILLLALYALTSVFYHIPMAALAGLIIHAVANLMTPPSALYRYWRLSPFELLIWVVGVVVAMFVSLETSIYTTVALSFALLLVRMARSEGSFLGETLVYRLALPSKNSESGAEDQGSNTETRAGMQTTGKMVYLPLNPGNSTPRIQISKPYPGIFVYRFNEAYNYVNKARHMDRLTSYVTANTRRTSSQDRIPLKDRLWSDPPTPASHSTAGNPILRAIVLDCSTINNLDIASIQGFQDARRVMEKHAAPALVEWHFAGLHNRWARRALAQAGFGYPAQEEANSNTNWCPTYAVACSSMIAAEQRSETVAYGSHKDGKPDEEVGKVTDLPVVEETAVEPVYGLDRPFYHVDVPDAVDAAVRNAKKRDGVVDLSPCDSLG